MEMDRKTDGEPVNVSTPAAHGAEPEVPLWRGLALGVAVAVGVSASIVIFGRPHAALSPAAHAPAVVEEAYEADGADEATQVARWAARSGDAGRRPFIIVDKANARVMAFDAKGQLRASTPALLGAARGDDSVPGIGTKKIADIKPEERITPAGRFVARPGMNLDGEDIVWIDYDAAVSMHRVRATKASERRLQRLASPTIADNRISWGCINLPAAFYDAQISPMVKASPSVVYVLPETRPLREVFAMGRRAERHAALSASWKSTSSP
jgi:hypothetical protein